MPISKTFEYEQPVRQEEIDGLGHVNNQVYLDWIMHAATAHSAAVGWDIGRLIERGEGWVVRSHALDYLQPVLPGDTVLMRTWIETAERASSERRYEIFRKSDGRKVFEGRSVWVWINYKSGRPARIPAEVIAAFKAWDQAASPGAAGPLPGSARP